MRMPAEDSFVQYNQFKKEKLDEAFDEAKSKDADKAPKEDHHDKHESRT